MGKGKRNKEQRHEKVEDGNEVVFEIVTVYHKNGRVSVRNFPLDINLAFIVLSTGMTAVAKFFAKKENKVVQEKQEPGLWLPNSGVPRIIEP